MSRKDYSIAARPVYDLPPPTAGLPYKGGLGGLRTDDAPPAPLKGRAASWAFAAGVDTWLDPGQLERDLDGDPELRALADQRAARLAEGASPQRVAKALRKLAPRVQRVFVEATLTAITVKFESVRPLVAEYVLAKAAARAAHPARFPDDEIE